MLEVVHHVGGKAVQFSELLGDFLGAVARVVVHLGLLVVPEVHVDDQQWLQVLLLRLVV